MVLLLVERLEELDASLFRSVQEIKGEPASGTLLCSRLTLLQRRIALTVFNAETTDAGEAIFIPKATLCRSALICGSLQKMVLHLVQHHDPPNVIETGVLSDQFDELSQPLSGPS